MEDFENCKEKIKEKINSGEYCSVKRKSKSEVFNIFMNIRKSDGNIIKNIVICERCKNVYKFNENCTSNLLRHHCYKKYKIDQEKYKVKVQPSNELKKKCVQLVVQWVVGNCRPFNITNDEGLHNLAEFFLNTGHTFGENIDLKALLPHSSTVARNVASLYNEQCSLMKDELQLIKNVGFAITIDLWTDNYLRESYIGVTIHYVKNKAVMHKTLGMREMDNEKNTGINIRMEVENILRDFDCEFTEMVTVVTDRGTSMKTAFKNDRSIFCISDLLNDVIEKAIADVEEVSQISNACAKLVKYSKKTDMNNALSTPLKSFTSTRWNTFFLLKSIEQNWENITLLLEETDAIDRKSNIDMNVINEILNVLDPFEESSRLLEDEKYPTLHCFYPQVHKLKTLCLTCNNDSQMTKIFKEKLLFYLSKIIDPNISILHKIALFLFPPTNKLQNFEEKEKYQIKEECKKMMKAYEQFVKVEVSTEEFEAVEDAFSAFVQSSVVLNQDDEVSNEILRYETKNVLYYKDFNVLEWWETHSREYPLLYKLSCFVFAIPASSSASERFSKARHLLSVLGKNPNNVNQIIFLNSNLDLSNICSETLNI